MTSQIDILINAIALHIIDEDLTISKQYAMLHRFYCTLIDYMPFKDFVHLVNLQCEEITADRTK